VINFSAIVAEVARRHGVKVRHIFGWSRHGEVVRARHAAMTECFRQGATYSEIGRRFSRDRATVRAAVHKNLRTARRPPLPAGFIDWEAA
jgi:chromosomal replication initiation ATPase DnaA